MFFILVSVSVLLAVLVLVTFCGWQKIRIAIKVLNGIRYKQSCKRTLKNCGRWVKWKLGGAIFADFRYGNVFVYHNGAESYYAVRGFRGSVKV